MESHKAGMMYLQKFILIGYKLTKGKSLGVDEINPITPVLKFFFGRTCM